LLFSYITIYVFERSDKGSYTRAKRGNGMDTWERKNSGEINIGELA